MRGGKGEQATFLLGSIGWGLSWVPIALSLHCLHPLLLQLQVSTALVPQQVQKQDYALLPDSLKGPKRFPFPTPFPVALL